MHVGRLRVLCIVVFKKFKPFPSNYLLRNSDDLEHYRPNQVTFGSNSLRSLGSQIWGGLPNGIKSTENLNSFKNMIENGMGKSVNVMLVVLCIDISFFVFN